MRIYFASEPASEARPNEDFVVATTDTVVVLDGVGTAGAESGCIHRTPWYVGQLGPAILQAIQVQPDATLAGSLASAISVVREKHVDTCDVEHPGTPSSTVSILQQRAGRLRYLALADSPILLADRHGDVTVICDIREEAASNRLRTDIDALPNGTPEHDQARRTFMERIQQYRNAPGGFWVAAAKPASAEQAITGEVPTDAVARAAVLSDGASRLVDRFELMDYPELMQTLATAGPSELIRQTRKAESTDPRGERWPRAKAYDDATAVYCDI